MKTGRYLFLGALTLGAAMAMVACGGDEEDGNNLSPEPGTGANVEVGEMTDVDIQIPIIMVNNWGNQISSELRPFYTAGSELSRMSVWARFCEDEACNKPVSVVQLELPSVDEHGRALFMTALPSGEPATDTAAVRARLPKAPAGASYMQLIGDTQRGSTVHTCGQAGALCPSEMDVVQTSKVRVDGEGDNPPPSTTLLENVRVGDDRSLPVHHLGHLVLGVTIPENPPTSTGETLMVAHSNSNNSFRNHVSLFSLDDIADASKRVIQSERLQIAEGLEAGDICGFLFDQNRDNPTLGMWLTGDEDGARIRVVGMDDILAAPSDDAQTALLDAPDPTNAETWPWPCKGVMHQINDTRAYAVLLQYKGAGSTKHSQPYPIYVAYTSPRGAGIEAFYDGTELADYALRDVVLDPRNPKRVIAIDMDWSQDAVRKGIGANRLVMMDLNVINGAQALVASFPASLSKTEVVLSGITSSFQCGESLSRPTGMVVRNDVEANQLLIGHDNGIAVYDLDQEEIVQNIDLTAYGHGFSEIHRDGDGWVAVPQCKSSTYFQLPYQNSTSNIDRHILVELVAKADGSLQVRPDSLDIDGDGTVDGGIDIDNYFLKAWLRKLIPTHPLPPFVITFPRAAIGTDMIAVRGSGIQGSGPGTDSNSGMGALGDVAIYSRSTGRFYNLRGRNPVFEGTTDQKYRVGLQLQSFEDSSTGAMVILP